MKKRFFILHLLFLILLLAACRQEKPAPSVIFGQPEEDIAPTAYDLSEIQAAGELIAVTLSGPDTYYEYRGRGFGLEFEMAEAFASSIGTRLRMEMAPDTAELLRRLAAGEADLIALEIDSGGWQVRPTSVELAAAVKRWWKPDTKERFLAAEAARRQSLQRSQTPRLVRPPMLSRAQGIISSYDNLFIRHAATAGMDWRLLAAQCYQESAFNPRAVSWAGAQGLMQIMPGTASHLGLSASEVFEPEKNVAAATRYIRELAVTFSDIPERRERLSFILAAYNGGVGHVRDAMALAQKHGKDPHRWADVNPFILALSQPRYYRDPVVKNGYLRGSETSGYVRQILERYSFYRGSARPAGNATPRPSTSSSAASPASSSSRVRPRSEFVLPTDTATPSATQAPALSQ
ncbi:MAG: transglycosylase SLT domain-containing protein [Bacteroidaceae bacterium]|nr:transglycosylase SLT domain-containing protein [Bacteroidaceae bacterium]